MSADRHLLAAGLGAMCFAFPASPSHANAARPTNGCAVFASEAAMRSGLPLDMILRVMRAESGGNPRAVSPKGAIGCMQIMPATWATLAARYGLASDPFDARMNMIGGALYLAELRTRFGIPGAYATYNAGPNRYTRFSANGVPLPAETVAYAARLGGAGVPIIKADAQARWQEAALFVARPASTSEPASVVPPSAVGMNDSAADRATAPTDSAPSVRLDPMFPLGVRNVALRR
jgi:hypothetical protein